jgi:hypothetical protein
LIFEFKMLNRAVFILGLLVQVADARQVGAGQSQKEQVLPESRGGSAVQPSRAIWIADNLHLAGQELTSFQGGPDRQVMVLRGGFAMSVAHNQLSSDQAVVWLQRSAIESGQDRRIGSRILAYLKGNVLVRKTTGAKTPDLSQTVVKDSGAMVVRFDVSGEVFITADKKGIADPAGSELYAEAFAAVAPFEPQLQPKPQPPESRPKEPTEAGKKLAGSQVKEPNLMYPLNIAQLGEIAPKPEWDEKTKTGTVVGRFYLWQKLDEKGGLLELQADNAVVFASGRQRPSGQRISGLQDILASGATGAIYLSGDVIMTEGQRTIRADQIYYDFEGRRALALNAVMRTFDVTRGIPIYVRAARLRQVAENRFAAENITLTTSEFFLPQISVSASKIIIADTTSVDLQQDTLSDNSFDAQIQDVRFKMYDRTYFYWPSVRGSLLQPDVPLKSVRAGHDSTFGTSVETQWYLARLLGLQEAKGTEGTLGVDYYDKRGLGSGIEIDYVREKYFGRLLGYIIDDHGEDRLGRIDSRKNLEPPQELRGRFKFQHRQFLPYNWQLTTEASYTSDKNFLEQYYRSEFNADKEQETIVHAKRLEDNWALSLLGKWRLNDFADTMEELPSAEFHWTGQSLWNDKLTLYSDNQVSRFRQRLGSDGQPAPSGAEGSPVLQDFFTFGSTRNELDMPMAVGRSKVVPFVAGTVGYEDGSGFRTEIDGDPASREDEVWLGEGGVRVSTPAYWKVYPDVESQLWDLSRLRHVIQPRLTAVAYTQSDSVVEQRDALNLGVSQRLQTKRGPADKLRTVDWMRLDVDFTWVNDPGDTSAGPDRFIWNRPYIPLANRFTRTTVAPDGSVSRVLPPQDRRSSNVFGPARNYIGADYLWQLSDTTAVLSDLNYDMQSGVVQQFDIGFSRRCWPSLSYYIGSRYLRRLDNGLGEKGSNTLTFTATYELDPRYTLVFSQQMDLDYGLNIRSDITVIRRYHRLYLALTYSADESLNQHAVVLSIWPQGVPEMAIGPSRYMALGTTNY